MMKTKNKRELTERERKLNEYYWKCFLSEFSKICIFLVIFLYSSIMLAMHITPAKLVACTSIFLCGLLGYFLVPVTSSNRPAATTEQITKCKRNTVIIILIFFILICFCFYNTYILIGYWTVILHILQLIIAHITKEVTING